jgi:hypothetical protein
LTPYTQLKDRIKNILIDYPLNYIDEMGTLHIVRDWETFSSRICVDEEDIEEESRVIGSGNMINCSEEVYIACENYLIDKEHKEINIVVSDILRDILEELVSEKILRKSPSLLRENIKIIKKEE